MDRLNSGAALPNTRTAAYLLAMACKEKLEGPDHDLLVTTANLAVLEVWLADLDKITFDVEQWEGETRLSIEGQAVPLSSAQTSHVLA